MEIVSSGGANKQSGETSKLTGNDSSTTPLRCGSFLWNTATHPVINPSLSVAMTFVVGFCGAASVLPKYLDCLDDCDPGGLGSFNLRITLIAVGLGLYCGNNVIGIWGAKQRSDHLNQVSKVRSEAFVNLNTLQSESHLMKFGQDAGSILESHQTSDKVLPGGVAMNPSSDDKQPLEGTCCPLNPLTVSFISGVGAIPCGLGMGMITLLLTAPTLLGGSGYDLSGLKAGSKGMWGGLVGLVATVILFGYLIYKNHVNTKQVISTTEVFKSDIDSISLQMKQLENPRLIFQEI